MKISIEKLQKKQENKEVNILRATTKTLEDIGSVPEDLEGPIEQIFTVKNSKLELRLEYQKGNCNILISIVMRQKILEAIARSFARQPKIRSKVGEFEETLG